MKILVAFNNKGGVGKTALVLHLGWMLAELGKRVLMVDLDPQANLTALCLPESRLEQLWPVDGEALSVAQALAPLRRGVGDVAACHVEAIDRNLDLLPGDVALSGFEDALSETWPKCLDGDERAFRITSAFYRMIRTAAAARDGDLILVDVGPNLGAINRSALIAASHVLIPLGPELLSLQGLRNLGPTLRTWRSGWQQRLNQRPAALMVLPDGSIEPLGYLIMRHSVRLDRPVKSYQRWIDRMPLEYRRSVLDQRDGVPPAIADDPHCLAQLKDYRSLMPMAQEAQKPMFFLKPGDGAIGGHQRAVLDCYKDYRALARDVLRRCGMAEDQDPVPAREGDRQADLLTSGRPAP